MANQSSSSSSSSYPILCASFNQDASHFVIGTREGFKVFDSNTGRLCYERAIGAFIVVEMLFTSSLLAIVGAGEQPSLSPRRLCLFNITTGTALRELNFLTSILAVRMNKERLIVILQDKTYVYDINKVKILDAIDTVPNLKGLCGFSPSLDGCFLALPASITKGSVLLYNVMELQSHCEIDAHRAPLAAIVLCSNGMYIATASEQGTIIRVHLVSDATKVFRGCHYIWSTRKHFESNVALTLELIRKLTTENFSPQSIVSEKNLTRENEIRKREDALLLHEDEAQKEKDKLIERERERENAEEAKGRTSNKDNRE